MQRSTDQAWADNEAASRVADSSPDERTPDNSPAQSALKRYSMPSTGRRTGGQAPAG